MTFMMPCANCGAAQDLDARFCGNCGLPVTTADAGETDKARPRLAVDPTAVWGAYATIMEAIRASVVPGTLIVVKPGTYREALVIDRVVEVVGEGDRERIVVEATNSDALTVTAHRAAVRNLTLRAVGTGDSCGAVWVRAGRAVISRCDLTSSIGSVVYVTGQMSDPIFQDCVVHDGAGGGLFFQDRSQGTIDSCTIVSNGLAGIMVSKSANPVIRNCVIEAGKQGRIFVYEQGSGTFQSCRIVGNAFSGIETSESGSPVVRGCEISGNGVYGVHAHARGRGDFIGNRLDGNRVGPWDIDGTSVVIRNGNVPNT